MYIKKLSLCHKLKFSKPHIFATCWFEPLKLTIYINGKYTCYDLLRIVESFNQVEEKPHRKHLCNLYI